MSNHESDDPSYDGTRTGQYPVEEHLAAQQNQLSASTGKPLHETAPEPEQATAQPTPEGIGDTVEATDDTAGTGDGNDAGVTETVPPIGKGSAKSGPAS